MERDRFGLALSTRSSRATDHYQSFVDTMWASSVGSEQSVEDAMAADEGFALPRIGHAYLRFAAGDMAAARARAAEALELGAGTTRREQQHVAAPRRDDQW